MDKVLKVKSLADTDKIGFNRVGDAGIDLRASGVWVVDMDSETKKVECESYEIQPGERIMAKTGVQVAVPEGCWGNIRDRSGLALKEGLHVLSGVLDETYRGEIGIVIVNLSKVPRTIKKNERIAQMIIAPYISPKIEYVEDLDNTIRNSDGFGSSGKE